MYDTVTRPPDASVRRDFKMHSSTVIKAIKIAGIDGAPDAMYLQGVASSTVRDRHGDTITDAGQAMMLAAAKSLTMWLNHSYNVPEDILGTCEESSLASSVDKDKNPVLDLIIRCKIESTNPRAVQSWQSVANGTQLGFSIGGAITDCEIDEANDDGDSWCPPLIINGLDLYEISLVGIPANPRAYTRSFVQEMSRGFMRNASRDPEVRKHLRAALPALRAGADDVQKTGIDVIGDGVVRTAFLDSGAIKSLEDTLDASGDATPAEVRAAIKAAIASIKSVVTLDAHEPVAGEAQCAFVEGCEAKNAAGSLHCEAHMVPIGDGSGELALGIGAPGGGITKDDDMSDSMTQSMLTAMKCLTDGMSHGMCTDSMHSIKTAHTIMKSMLPDDAEYDDPTEIPDDAQNAAPIEQTAEIERTIAEAAEKLASVTTQIEEQTKALEQISTTATQRAAEVTAAEIKRDALATEQQALQATIDTLKATPTGRQTSQAGGSSHGAYQPKSATMNEARKTLALAMAGQSVDIDPALRPA